MLPRFDGSHTMTRGEMGRFQCHIPAGKSAAELGTLRLVEPGTGGFRLPPVPHHLSRLMREWWRQVTHDFELDGHHLRLLESRCRAWDRMGRRESR
jgi:hypothetical protein